MACCLYSSSCSGRQSGPTFLGSLWTGQLAPRIETGRSAEDEGASQLRWSSSWRGNER